jgi:hypothetical protein
MNPYYSNGHPIENDAAHHINLPQEQQPIAENIPAELQQQVAIAEAPVLEEKVIKTGYSNLTHIIMRWILLPLSILLSFIGFFLGIPGWVLLAKHELLISAINPSDGKVIVLMNTEAHLPLSALGVVLELFIIFAGIITIFLSIISMRFEAKEETAADGRSRLIFRIGVIALTVAVFIVTLYFFAYTVVSAKRGEHFHDLTLRPGGQCPTSLVTCERVGRGFNLLEASSILGLLSLILLLMVLTPVISHLGSGNRKAI